MKDSYKELMQQGRVTKWRKDPLTIYALELGVEIENLDYIGGVPETAYSDVNAIHDENIYFNAKEPVESLLKNIQEFILLIIKEKNNIYEYYEIDCLIKELKQLILKLELEEEREHFLIKRSEDFLELLRITRVLNKSLMYKYSYKNFYY